MRSLVWLGLLSALVTACAHHRSQPLTAAGTQSKNNLFVPISQTQGQKLIVTPETGLFGKVVSVNPEGRFVVLNFPIGHLPALQERLNIYHLGLKVGEVKVSGPQRDDNIVGDLVAGNAAVGDEVREP